MMMKWRVTNVIVLSFEFLFFFIRLSLIHFISVYNYIFEVLQLNYLNTSNIHIDKSNT
jgi:hypothetical protein